MSIKIKPHDSEWPSKYKGMHEGLHRQVGCIEGIAFEHIGSTAVPTLSARPIIDILITVPQTNVDKIQGAFSSMALDDYHLDHVETQGIVFEAFHDGPHAHTIYLCEQDSLSARAHLAIRDTLRSDLDMRNEYNTLKHSASDETRQPVLGTYQNIKIPFLQQVLIASQHFSDQELATLLQSDETSRWAPITTERLVLREFMISDVDGMFALEGSEANALYQSWHPWTHLEARQNVLRGIQGSYEAGRSTVELAVVHGARFIGRIGGRVQEQSASVSQHPSVETNPEDKVTPAKHIDLWYSFLPAVQGQGLATEAIRAFIAHFVQRERRGAEVIELEIECDPRNTGSWKLAERLGFEKHSLTERAWECKGEWVDSLVYRKGV